MQQFIEKAIERGTKPRKTANESVILRGEGRDYKVLVSSAGNITKAGRSYQELTGAGLDTYSYDQKPKHDSLGERRIDQDARWQGERGA